MASAEARLTEWLRDAHAMEMQAETLLQAMAERIEDYPEMKARVERHMEETRGQARRIEECISRRGGETSTLGDIAEKFMALGQGISGVFVGDEIVRGAITGDTFEHMEISSYNALIAAADEVGDAATRKACEQNLREEEDMASWIENHIATLTKQYLLRG